jgi:hypothetical protein
MSEEDETYRREHVAAWHAAVRVARENAIEDADAWLVTEAVAEISTGAGLSNQIPQSVLLLVHEVMRIGYGRAVQDVRNGKVAGLGLA